jgi:homoserine kinase
MTAASEIRIRVPATSANLGPGFDAFGLALALYDEVQIGTADDGLAIEVEGEGAEEVPGDSSHLIVRSFHTALDAFGGSVDGLTLRCVNRIPHGRGLGSSAAAIVAGVRAAFELTGTPAEPAKVLRIAAGIEGHPDNVAACVYGGFTIAWGSGSAVRLDPHPALSVVAYVPPGALSTEMARGLLPETVPHADAAANAGRAALLATAVTTRPDLLPVATEDRLHQSYRASAMPDSAALLERLRDRGVPAVISGAGPTVLAFVSDQLTGSPAAPDGWTRLPLPIDPVGMQVLSAVRE